MTLYLVVGFLTFYLMVDSSSQLKLSIFFEKICIFIRIFGGWFLHYLLALLVFVHVSRFIFPWYLYLCNQGNLIFNDLKFFGKIDGTGSANERCYLRWTLCFQLFQSKIVFEYIVVSAGILRVWWQVLIFFRVVWPLLSFFMKNC